MTVPFAAGCLEANSEQAVQAETVTESETETPVENAESRRDAVQCYADGVRSFEDGRALLFDGNAALDGGDDRAAADAFERAGTAFGDALAEFEQAFEILSWLDLDDRDEQAAVTILEDAGQRTIHHGEAAENLQEVAVRRTETGSGDGEDRLEAAREALDDANDYPIRDASRLAAALSVGDE